ncbi:MAG: RNA polymerase sigma factor (sigma-70 family) [Myxococcota bacterium]
MNILNIIPWPVVGHSPSLEERALSGRREAWDVLIQQHNPQVTRYVQCRWGVVARTHDPGDIAQEAWRRLYQRVQDGLSGAKAPLPELSLPGLACAQARWVALELLSRKGCRSEVYTNDVMVTDPASSAPSPERIVLDRERIERLQSCLTQLTAKEQQVFRLFYREQRDYGEISRQLGISRGAVRMTISRARRHLQSLLEAGA